MRAQLTASGRPPWDPAPSPGNELPPEFARPAADPQLPRRGPFAAPPDRDSPSPRPGPGDAPVAQPPGTEPGDEGPDIAFRFAASPVPDDFGRGDGSSTVRPAPPPDQDQGRYSARHASAGPPAADRGNGPASGPDTGPLYIWNPAALTDPFPAVRPPPLAEPDPPGREGPGRPVP